MRIKAMIASYVLLGCFFAGCVASESPAPSAPATEAPASGTIVASGTSAPTPAPTVEIKGLVDHALIGASALRLQGDHSYTVSAHTVAGWGAADVRSLGVAKLASDGSFTLAVELIDTTYPVVITLTEDRTGTSVANAIMPLRATEVTVNALTDRAAVTMLAMDASELAVAIERVGPDYVIASATQLSNGAFHATDPETLALIILIDIRAAPNPEVLREAGFTAFVAFNAVSGVDDAEQTPAERLAKQASAAALPTLDSVKISVTAAATMAPDDQAVAVLVTSVETAVAETAASTTVLVSAPLEGTPCENDGSDPDVPAPICFCPGAPETVRAVGDACLNLVDYSGPPTPQANCEGGLPATFSVVNDPIYAYQHVMTLTAALGGSGTLCQFSSGGLSVADTPGAFDSVACSCALACPIGQPERNARRAFATRAVDPSLYGWQPDVGFPPHPNPDALEPSADTLAFRADWLRVYEAAGACR